MKGQIAISPLIAVMIVLIVGVAVAVPVVQDTTNQATLTYSLEDEQITGTDATTDTLLFPRTVSSVVIYNATGGSLTIGSGNYTLDSANGRIVWSGLNNTLYPSPQWVNYTGHYTSYQASGSTRTLLNVLPLLVVLALVLVVVGYMKFK